MTFTIQERKNIFDKYCWYCYQNQNFMKIKVIYTCVYVVESQNPSEKLFFSKDKSLHIENSDIRKQLFRQNRSFLCIVQIFTIVKNNPNPMD